MANHHDDGNQQPNPEFLKMFQEMRKTGDAMVPSMRLGPMSALGKLNDHPAGMYGPEDEGATQFAVGSDHQNEKVILDFGSPVKWMAMDPREELSTQRGQISAT